MLNSLHANKFVDCNFVFSPEQPKKKTIGTEEKVALEQDAQDLFKQRPDGLLPKHLLHLLQQRRNSTSTMLKPPQKKKFMEIEE